MKTLLNSILALIFMLCSSVYADELSHRAAAEEFMKISKADQMIKPVREQMRAMMEQQFAQMNVPDRLKSLMKKYNDKLYKVIDEQLDWVVMKDDFISIYVEIFSEDEIKTITAFYKTPVGQSFLEKTPVLMKRSMELSQKRMPELMTKVEKITAEMIQEMKVAIEKESTQENIPSKGQ